MSRIVVETETLKSLIGSLLNAEGELFEMQECGTNADRIQAERDVKIALDALNDYLKPNEENKP